MKLIFVGTDGSMGLRKNGVYDCKIYSDFGTWVWLIWRTENGTRKCPYSSLHNLLQNWVEIVVEG